MAAPAAASPWLPSFMADPLPFTAIVCLGAFAFLGLGMAMGGALRDQSSAASAAKANPVARRDRRTDHVNEVEKHLDQELGRILGLIRSHLQASGSYSASLNQAHRSLQTITTPEQVRLTVEALILENEKMRNKARDLDQRLDQARGQIESLRSNLAEAEEISLKDPLTALSNRRSFDQSLQRAISEAQQNGSPLCLIMGDIDHFKRINDTFGHLVGDAVLKRFAELLTKGVGVNDMVARFGGEEFAVILPGVSTQRAKGVAESIRRTLEGKKWVATDAGQQLGTITASFGVSELRPDDEPEDLVRRADTKLYEAKCAGRNRVMADVRLAA